MYDISFDNYFKLLNWNIIFWGIKADIISAKSAIDYANALIKRNILKNETLLISLLILDNICKEEVLKLIINIKTNENFNEDESLRILRYIILDNIQESIKDNKEILNNIENVYADFDYPSDMDSFISYMPANDYGYDVSEHTQEENEQRLIKKFNLFLSKEKHWIQQIQSRNQT